MPPISRTPHELSCPHTRPSSRLCFLLQELLQGCGSSSVLAELNLPLYQRRRGAQRAAAAARTGS